MYARCAIAYMRLHTKYDIYNFNKKDLVAEKMCIYIRKESFVGF